MAQFTTGIGQTDDLKKVQDYLYKLNKDLEYMFSHLTPEDNYSEPAYTKYLQDGEKVTQIETSVDGLKVLVKDNETNYNTSLRLMAGYLGLTASTPAGESSVVVSGDRIQLTTGNFIINAENGGKTTFAVDRYGNATFGGDLNAAGGTFSGTVTAATFNGVTINGATINGKTLMSCGDEFFIDVDPSYSAYDFILGDFEIEKSQHGSRTGYCLHLTSPTKDLDDLAIWDDGVIWAYDIALKTLAPGGYDQYSVADLITTLWDCISAGSTHPENYLPY